VGVGAVAVEERLPVLQERAVTPHSDHPCLLLMVAVVVLALLGLAEQEEPELLMPLLLVF
jgi:hypothetical protein